MVVFCGVGRTAVYSEASKTNEACDLDLNSMVRMKPVGYGEGSAKADLSSELDNKSDDGGNLLH